MLDSQASSVLEENASYDEHSFVKRAIARWRRRAIASTITLGSDRALRHPAITSQFMKNYRARGSQMESPKDFGVLHLVQ